MFGSAGTKLETGLSEHRADLEEQGELLDAFFRGRMVMDESYPVFGRVKKKIEDNGGLVPVDEIARAAGVSLRNLGRLFGRFLGFSPKYYARVVRFQKVLRLLMNDATTTLGTVSAECGYFDQSHSVKDFRKFTGGIPRGYKGYYPPQAPADFAPNVVRFLQDDGKR